MKDKNYKSIFAKNLNYWMQVRGKTQSDIINDLDINKSAISSWCNATRIPKMNTISILADYLHINLSDLLENKNDSSKDQNEYISKIPLLSDYKNNLDYSLDNFYTKEIVTNDEIPNNSFGLISKDNSMSPLLDVGDIAIVTPTKDFVSGNTYLIINHNIAIIRKIVIINNTFELQALNPYYPTEKVNDINIIGKVIKVELKSAFK